jgi:hypothetical protein
MNTTNVEEEKTKLKTGYTTGSCATAASKAALLSIINQKKIENVDILLPKRSYIQIPINLCEFESDKAKCIVIKNGGDDPDVTHGAEIIVELSFTKKINEIEIDGGEGVGIVTKPGLGLEINKPAINPVPKKMITENLREVGKEIQTNAPAPATSINSNSATPRRPSCPENSISMAKGRRIRPPICKRRPKDFMAVVTKLGEQEGTHISQDENEESIEKGVACGHCPTLSPLHNNSSNRQKERLPKRFVLRLRPCWAGSYHRDKRHCKDNYRRESQR